MFSLANRWDSTPIIGPWNAPNNLSARASLFFDSVERASRAAPLNRPVLVIGERGTGKELIAERLHHLSSRWAGPLIIMNCAALPENLIEAELFGHEAGSFTGAAKTRHGRFEEADGGTLFLDELGTLSMPAQDRLLRATEYGEITRIGASKPISVDVRIVAATNENLPTQVDRGSSGPICSTACRSRSLRCRRYARATAMFPCLPNISGAACRSSSIGPIGRGSVARHGGTREFRWPGNVRELRNVVERAVYRHEDPERPIEEIVFDPFHSPWAPRSADMPAPCPGTPNVEEDGGGRERDAGNIGAPRIHQRLPRRGYRL